MTLFTQSDLANLERHLPSAPVPAGWNPPTEFPPIHKAKWISYDIESHDENLKKKGPGFRRDAYIVGHGVRTDSGFAAYYPVRHVVGQNCDPDKVTAWLRDELGKFKGELVGANLMYDADAAQCAGIRMPHVKFRDVQFAEPLLDEQAHSYSLATLAKKYDLEEKESGWLKSLYGDDVMEHFREVHPAHATTYSLGDTRLPPEILAKQRVQLAKEKLVSLFELESRLVPVLLYMRELGIRVDLEKAEELEKYLAIRRDENLLTMQRIAGFPVDPDSNQDLAQACEKLGVPFPYTAPTSTYPQGQPSFQGVWIKAQAASDWMDECDPTKEFFSALLNARKYEKYRNPFVASIMNDSINGRIHALFHPLRTDENGARTGRLSSSHINLQNIPIRDAELGPALRALFLPDEGMDWWSGDYSQLEYRLIVDIAAKKHCAGAQDALRRYKTDPDTDFHAFVAELTGLPRNIAKSISYGLAFSMGLRLLAKNIGQTNPDGSPNKAALEILDTYHANVPFVRELSRAASDYAQKHGYIRTLLGRKTRYNMWEPDTAEGYLALPRPYEEAVATYGKVRRSQTHKALNSYSQGSNADLTKSAMVLGWEQGLFTNRSLLTLSSTVHDELDGSKAPTEAGTKALGELKHIMEHAIEKGISIPITTEFGCGLNWGEAH